MLYDILLPVDKFTAAGAWLPCNWVVLHCVARVLMQPADVMREVTIYDTIEPQANYSAKVHSLAPFHASGHLDEIDDPLYGSTSRGGPEEVAAVTAAATLLDSCCEARALRRISHASAETLRRTPAAGPCRLHCIGGRGCGRGQRRRRGGVARAAQRAARAADQQRPDGVAAAAHAQPARLILYLARLMRV